MNRKWRTLVVVCAAIFMLLLLNNLLVVSGVVALFGAMCSVLLIRFKDFVSPAPPPVPTTDPAGAQAVGVPAGRT